MCFIYASKRKKKSAKESEAHAFPSVGSNNKTAKKKQKKKKTFRNKKMDYKKPKSQHLTS